MHALQAAKRSVHHTLSTTSSWSKTERLHASRPVRQHTGAYSIYRYLFAIALLAARLQTELRLAPAALSLKTQTLQAAQSRPPSNDLDLQAQW